MNAEKLWQPTDEQIAHARITQFTNELRAKYEQRFPDYKSVWRWSLANKETFWREVWRFCECVGDLGERVAIDGHKMPGVQWFPDGQLNFAENLLRRASTQSDRIALSFASETESRAMTWCELSGRVGAMQRALTNAGVRAGDVVASVLPNTPEAVIAMLGATSIGATWSSTSPDFGAAGVLDRFAQISPKVLFACDGYTYNGQWHSTVDRVSEIVAGLPGLEHVVRLSEVGNSVGAVYRDQAAVKTSAHSSGNSFTATGESRQAAPTELPWTEFLGGDLHEPTFERFPFNHPLFIVYSSGTTGKPKAIIHGAGGTLLQLVKEHALHGDLRVGDRLFYFTTTGWIMWQWLV
ncbi:MAG: AMP-binding protein, partial [Casimicrobium sp.]